MNPELQAVQRSVPAAPDDQFIVRAVLDEASALQGYDAIGAAHGRKAVGDDENRAVPGDVLHVLLDDSFTLVVEGACRLIEYQDPRVRHQRTCDSDALALPAREGAAALANDRIIALGQLEDELVCAGEFGGGDHLRHRHRWIDERDVVANGMVEKDVLLQHDADLAAQPSDVDAVDEDTAALRHVEAVDELGERALARPGRADDADDLTGLHDEADVVQDLRPVDTVTESDVVEGDIAADRRQRRARRIVARLRRGVEDVAEPRDREPGLVKILPELRQSQHWRAHPAGKDIESDQLADAQALIDDELRAKIEGCSSDELAHELHGLACYVVEAEDAETRRDISGKLFLPATLHLRLDRHRLERLDAGHALDEERLVLGATCELFVEAPAEKRRGAG